MLPLAPIQQKNSSAPVNQDLHFKEIGLPSFRQLVASGFNPSNIPNTKLAEFISKMSSPADTQYLVDAQSSDPEFCFKQPGSRPLSHEELEAEVKTIYDGLVLVESKCRESLGPKAHRPDLDQLTELLALHKTLLHDHYDYMLASQHYSASPEIKSLADTNLMPQRMVKFGIIDPLNYLAKQENSREHYISLMHHALGICNLLDEMPEADRSVYKNMKQELTRRIIQADARV